MPIPAPIEEPVSLPRQSSGAKRRLLAALLSAVVPGTGQVFLGQRRKGLILLGIFVIVCLGFWPLRLLSDYPGLVLLLWASLGLTIYATNSALLARSSPLLPALSKWWMLLGTLLAFVGFNLVFTSLLFTAGFRALQQISSAMEPTLLNGDRFMIDRNYYRQHPCERGDLVVMRIVDAQTVKRVIAIGGDTIEGKDKEVLLNGHVLDERFAYHPRGGGMVPEQDNFGPITVAAGKYFVMGDNRDTSRDSRMADYGQVDKSAILGRPLYVYLVHPWSRNGHELH
jgi:signal peptidase I